MATCTNPARVSWMLQGVLCGCIKQLRGPLTSKTPHFGKAVLSSDTGKTSTVYRSIPPETTTTERQSRVGCWVLRPDAQKMLRNADLPNPGSDPPPVTLARDARKGLHREVEFHGREYPVPLIL